MSELAKLRWRCRRGMRELDALMLAWLDSHHQDADEPTRQKFAELLAMQDPDIMTLLKKLNGPEASSVANTASSKDSSFETIIQQARKAAAMVAASNASKITGPSSSQSGIRSDTPD